MYEQKCVLEQRSNRQVVVVAGSFLSETVAAAAVSPRAEAQQGRRARVRARCGPTYKSESLARTHQFAAVLLQVGYPINATQISTPAT